ncbi:hypothetical protein D1872_182350 [compost metagenome]
MRNLRLLMHFFPDAMPNEFAYDREAFRFRVGLYRMGNISDPVTDNGLLNPFIQRFLGNIQQLLRLLRHITHRIRPSGICQPAIQVHNHVDRHDVPVLQRCLIRKAVANHIVR